MQGQSQQGSMAVVLQEHSLSQKEPWHGLVEIPPASESKTPRTKDRRRRSTSTRNYEFVQKNNPETLSLYSTRIDGGSGHVSQSECFSVRGALASRRFQRHFEMCIHVKNQVQTPLNMNRQALGQPYPQPVHAIGFGPVLQW